jgi:hypothetical protein
MSLDAADAAPLSMPPDVVLPDAAQPDEVINPQQYREGQQAETGYRLQCLDVAVQLLPDPRRAQYTYTLHLKTVGAEPADRWRHDVPARGRVTNVSVYDEAGGLQYALPPDGPGRARLEVHFRRRVGRGESYVFTYSYEAQINTVIGPGALTQTITYGDWLMPNLPCDRLRVRVLVPPRAVRMAAVPAPTDEDGESVRYEQDNLRPLENMGFLVAYRKRKVGVRFWQWVASAAASGLLGAFIAEALDRWL